jgi:hypothetical protein
MARPPEDRSSFPTHLAEALAAELVGIADKLDEAVTARSRAWRRTSVRKRCTASSSAPRSVSSGMAAFRSRCASRGGAISPGR